VRHKIKFLILVSGHEHYAVNGYDVQANGFLTKPFDFKKFKALVDRIIDRSKIVKPFIFVKTKEAKEMVKIFVEEIFYIEGARNYIIIHLESKSITTLMKLSEIEEKLKKHQYFIRIHKSFMVSVNHVEKYQEDFVYLTNKKSLPVSETYKDNLVKSVS